MQRFFGFVNLDEYSSRNHLVLINFLYVCIKYPIVEIRIYISQNINEVSNKIRHSRYTNLELYVRVYLMIQYCI